MSRPARQRGIIRAWFARRARDLTLLVTRIMHNRRLVRSRNVLHNRFAQFDVMYRDLRDGRSLDAASVIIYSPVRIN